MREHHGRFAGEPDSSESPQLALQTPSDLGSAAGDPDGTPAPVGIGVPARRWFAATAWRAMAVTSALALAAVLGTAAPVWAQSTAGTTQTGHLSVWVSDGFGGGTVIGPAGIHCHQAPMDDPYGTGYQPDPTGVCDASYPVGTSVTLTATPDPGSYLNYWDPPSSACTYHSYSCTLTVKIVQGYNAADFMFCPEDGICSAMD